jgi:hypothetical protein
VIDCAPRCRDDHVDATSQATQLLADRLAAVDREDPDTEIAPIAGQRLGDLHRQLARRDEDDRGGAAVRGATDLERLESWQRERSRLAGPGGCLGQEVAAREQRRDGLALDGGRFLVAQLAERLEQGGLEPEISERRRRCVGCFASRRIHWRDWLVGLIGVSHLECIVVQNGGTHRSSRHGRVDGTR